ncbi:MAG: hypothetical protein D6731_04425 [Planctomycetota bacterium]|nr:MAG: hypothetical protein D6731_04425 [Planctomycetota bacterium]
MSAGALLLCVVLLAAATAALGFSLGERRRRAEAGGAGPRPAPSIGEALRLASARRGRALVVFCGGEGAGDAADDGGFGPGAPLPEGLVRPGLVHCMVQAGEGEGREVAAALFRKYADEELGEAGAAALLLEGDGALVAVGRGQGPPSAWLGPWLEEVLPRSPAPASPTEASGGDDRPVAGG